MDGGQQRDGKRKLMKIVWALKWKLSDEKFMIKIEWWKLNTEVK